MYPHIGKWLLLPVVLIAFLILPCAFAQETTAGFQGAVKDPSGAAKAVAAIDDLRLDIRNLKPDVHDRLDTIRKQLRGAKLR